MRGMAGKVWAARKSANISGANIGLATAAMPTASRRAGLMAGSAMLCALGLYGLPGHAFAQANVAGTARTITYAIPASPVSAALASFSAASGVQLVYDSSLTTGLRSGGVSGARTPEQALGAILAGTGLRWRFTTPTSVIIESNRSQGNTPVFADPPADGSIQLDAITISGEKLTRDLANVYSSVGVVTGQQLFDFVIPDLQGALNKLANTRTFSADRGNSGIVIRGVSSEGLTQPVNSSPVISVIVDGAAQNGEGTRRGSRGTWDVESVEVFRGPQSTLQGRNAMAGAVVVNTYNPTWHWEGAMEGDFAGAGNSGQLGSGAFMLSGPLVENQVAFRVAGQYAEGNRGITYADPLNNSLDDDEFGQIRGKVLITPDALDGFRALFTVSHTNDKPGVAAASGPDYFARYFSQAVSAVELRKTNVTNLVADLSQDFGNGITFRSVSAYVMTGAQIDSPGGSTAFIRDEVRDGADFTQDLRLELAEGVRPLSGVIGLNYGRFTIDTTSDISISLPDFGLIGLPYQDLVSGTTTTTLAAYADFRYELTDRWSLLFGGRLGYERVENTLNGTVFNFDVFDYDQITQNAATDYLIALPKLGIAYEIDDHQTLAFTVSEGFRAGFATVDFEGQVYDVDPEYLWAYEVAYRSRWFNDRLEVNANGFYYDFRNLQIEVDDPNPISPMTITQNIGKAHAYGAEIELRARPFEGFTTFASLGLLKTVLDDAVTATGNYSGNDFPEAPAITFNVGATYKHASGLFASADLSYTGNYFSVGDIANSIDAEVTSFTIVNASVGYETKNWSLTLFAKNIFDEQYVTGINIDDFGSEATVGDGRMLGIRAKATF